MNKEELLEAIQKGIPIARKYDKLYHICNFSILQHLIGMFIMGIIITISLSILFAFDFKSIITFIQATFESIKVFSLISPIIILIGLFSFTIRDIYGNIGNSILLKIYRKKINEILETFNKETNLHESYCDVLTLHRFENYLNRGMADTLKECALLYQDENNKQDIIYNMY